jgi:hypothetical protein
MPSKDPKISNMNYWNRETLNYSSSVLEQSTKLSAFGGLRLRQGKMQKPVAPNNKL